MQTASILKDLTYNDSKPAISVLMESETSKEIRILMKEGQEMKEHKTKFPITVELFEGAISFSVEGKTYEVSKGDLLSLDAHIPHSLIAKKDSIIRLTLSKLDTVDRVQSVADQK